MSGHDLLSEVRALRDHILSQKHSFQLDVSRRVSCNCASVAARDGVSGTKNKIFVKIFRARNLGACRDRGTGRRGRPFRRGDDPRDKHGLIEFPCKQRTPPPGRTAHVAMCMRQGRWNTKEDIHRKCLRAQDRNPPPAVVVPSRPGAVYPAAPSKFGASISRLASQYGNRIPHNLRSGFVRRAPTPLPPTT